VLLYFLSEFRTQGLVSLIIFPAGLSLVFRARIEFHPLHRRIAAAVIFRFCARATEQLAED
jgi:hypothetical protein